MQHCAWMFSNSARVGGDINPSWPHITGMIDTDEPLAPWAGPGFWNDNDSEFLYFASSHRAVLCLTAGRCLLMRSAGGGERNERD